MAKPVAKITLGIDVAKDQHVVCNWQTEETFSIPNQRSEIKTWLKSFHGPVQIAIEPTSHYHLAVVEEAQALGYEVFLINPRQLVHYREAVNLRHKTDILDAQLLARYLQHEGRQLRPFQPQDPRAQRLWALVLRRATVVQSRQQLQQSFRELNLSIQGLLTQFERLLERMERQMITLVRELGWWSDYRRCQSIPGIGLANAAALTAAYHRGAFAGSDAFVAYMGLDVRLRESGKYKGQRKLTKRGEAELRRLLYCAGKPAQTCRRFANYHQQLLDKGMCKIAARVALGRKLARIAFTLMSRQQFFKKPEEIYCTSP